MFRLLLYLLLNRADSYLKKLTENEETQIQIVFYVIYILCWQVFRLLLYLLLNRADSYLKKLTREWGDSDYCLLCDIYSLLTGVPAAAVPTAQQG